MAVVDEGVIWEDRYISVSVKLLQGHEDISIRYVLVDDKPEMQFRASRDFSGHIEGNLSFRVPESASYCKASSFAPV